jgi:hypothetical protein
MVFDTGATISVSPHYADFISWEQSTDDLTLRNGITARTHVKGAGVVDGLFEMTRVLDTRYVQEPTMYLKPKFVS